MTSLAARGVVALSHRIRTLRYRLLALVLVPLVLLAVTVILLAARWSIDLTYRQLRAMVTTDLSVAHDVFARLQSDALSRLDVAASEPALLDAMNAGDALRLTGVLAGVARSNGFDRLVLHGVNGRNPAGGGARIEVPLALSPLWKRLQRQDTGPAGAPSAAGGAASGGAASGGAGRGVVGVEVLPAAHWAGELDERAVQVALVDTPRAAPDERAVAGAVEDRALMVRALHPVIDGDGMLLGWLDGGVLLNRNLGFVDAIRDLVYSPGRLAAHSQGTVTLFLDDVRISTNVPTIDDRRALGTRVSAEVRDHVLGQGLRWIDRAFVVNEWYVSAYEPIVDPSGMRIGMLYTGFPDAPFRTDLQRTIAALAVLSIAGALLAAVAATLGARAIFQPVERMAGVARATSRGEYRRIGQLDAADELQALARQFDAMLDVQEGQRRRIEHDARSLERKVDARTEALRERNARLQESLELLQRTREQLATAERLAALGELTAGVAHEINNPAAVILGNLDILVAEIGDARDGVAVEIELIMEQVFRIRSITDRLLALSRSDPASAAAAVMARCDATPVAALVADALALIHHERQAREVVIVEEHAPGLRVAIDPQQCLQVLVNLLQNAMEAADGLAGGVLTVIVRSRLVAERVVLEVEDDGPGIPTDHLPRLFDPFFTAGKPAGTGLGLWVSHGIVHRAGGRIEVVSSPGDGARFTLVLPQAGARRV